LRLAEAIGELSLALRGAEDQEIVALKGTRPHDLAKSNGTDAGPTDDAAGNAGKIASSIPDAPPTVLPPAAKPEEPPPPPKTVTQIIFNGESVTKTVYVRKEGEFSTQVEKTGMEREPRPEKKEAPPAKPEASAKKDNDSPAKPEATK
jgi:hypothetical protein